MIETQMAVKAKQVTELENQAEYLKQMDPDKVEEIVAKKSVVENRFSKLKDPLLLRFVQFVSILSILQKNSCVFSIIFNRKQQLEKKKEAYQFRRDVEDEKLWVDEKMPLATSSDLGNSLYNVTILKKKNKSMMNEIENHEPRIITIIRNGEKLINEGHHDADEFEHLNEELKKKWEELKDAVDQRKDKLIQSERAQQ